MQLGSLQQVGFFRRSFDEKDSIMSSQCLKIRSHFQILL